MIKITLAALLFSASFAQASDWVSVDNGDNLKVYLDRSSVARAGKVRKAWAAYSYTDAQLMDGKSYKSTKVLTLYSCSERTIGPYQKSWYAEENGMGAVVDTWQIQAKDVIFSDVVPDTIGEAVLDAVCRIKLPSI